MLYLHNRDTLRLLSFKKVFCSLSPTLKYLNIFSHNSKAPSFDSHQLDRSD